jgi:hypothetical protein
MVLSEGRLRPLRACSAGVLHGRAATPLVAIDTIRRPLIAESS